MRLAGHYCPGWWRCRWATEWWWLVLDVCGSPSPLPDSRLLRQFRAHLDVIYKFEILVVIIYGIVCVWMCACNVAVYLWMSSCSDVNCTPRSWASPTDSNKRNTPSPKEWLNTLYLLVVRLCRWSRLRADSDLLPWHPPIHCTNSRNVGWKAQPKISLRTLGGKLLRLFFASISYSYFTLECCIEDWRSA